MKFEVDKKLGYFKIIAQNAQENDEVGRLYKELIGIFESGKYKFVPLTDTCRDDRRCSFNSLEFTAVDEQGRKLDQFTPRFFQNNVCGGMKR